ncbi:MAG: hypothetical protein GWN16_01445 [Calditrichae bacterium]|nr:hypothetical protein [Calditrichia bacterium]NIW78188.1 hypothetical protein [Calditrichia bacterium]
MYEINNEELLLGDVPYKDILHYFPEWREHHLKSEVDASLIDRLKKIDELLNIVCYLGSWCSDSKQGVPPFMKALHKANNDNIRIQLIAVNRQKDEPQHRSIQHNIQRVPTFLIYKNGEEIGRLIEFPMQDNFIQDFLSVLASK